MTKIYQAYKKRTPDQSDFKIDLASLGDIRLFPAPARSQQVELARLADMLLQFKPADRGAVLCFASSISGEGTSYVSYNAARLLAYEMHRKIAWVDANFRSPHRRLLKRELVSFAELLQDPERVSELPSASSLTLVAGGVNLDSRAGDASSESAEQLVNGFAACFDFTILDCPPVLDAIEAGQLASHADGLVLVVQSRRLKREVVQHAMETLSARNVRVLGAVLNRRTFELPKLIYDRL
jgi:Mrp family chromosome partitioning ATPase